jgi:hypothetical protein
MPKPRVPAPSKVVFQGTGQLLSKQDLVAS